MNTDAPIGIFDSGFGGLTVARLRPQRPATSASFAPRRPPHPSAYDDAFAAAPQVRLTTSACPLFVEYLEAGIGTRLMGDFVAAVEPI